MTPDIHHANVRVAMVTGGSRGLGRALTLDLLAAGWQVVTDGRDAEALIRLREQTANPDRLVTLPGDVADPDHRAALIGELARFGGLDLLVNNASLLGPSGETGPTEQESPDAGLGLSALAEYAIAGLAEVYAVNLLAPLALIQLALPHLERRSGRIVNVSSDAAVEPYEGWGGYGSSKAALDQLTNVLAAEHPGLRIYAFDPGDMRTDMHSQAFPGEDISDRPEPESVVPALTGLIDGDLPSARYRASALLPQTTL
ncbi:MAG: SDR family oxidoreductase [Actinomycetota bacterium]|nr:SDR family oxidoreductase [Actinomycetota bacterium]